MAGEVVDPVSMNYMVFHLFSLITCMVVAGIIVGAVLRELRLPIRITGSIASILSLLVAYFYYQTFF
ncbi:hypothetical protein [Halobacillus seohaensis]|uniref:Uncharacterized protein n=1 Tax=Halobacillus seohaensis TaxID=447421 RepID=A0ABW2EQ81_9BACI